MRRNDERVGASPQTETPAVAAATPIETAPEPTHQNSVGLNFVIPTEFVEMPSRGQFYNEGHPLHNQDTVEIRHMTAKEEDILTSRTLLKKGIALDRLVDNVLVDKRIKAAEMFIGDKNAILLMSRILAYGPEYNTNVTCPSCYSQTRYDFNLLEYKTTHPEEIENPEFSITPNNTFKITLPRTKVEVEVKLLKGSDEQYLARISERKRKAKTTSDSILIEQMESFINSVNEISDKKIIKKFVETMPAQDSRFLRRIYATTVPNIDLTQNFECNECGVEIDMEVPFTTDFFWPK
jgi:hypothetical protein